MASQGGGNREFLLYLYSNKLANLFASNNSFGLQKQFSKLMNKVKYLNV